MLIHYPHKTLARFYQPRYNGELAGKGVVSATQSNPTTYEQIRFYLRIAEGSIQQARFQCRGEVATVAVCDLICQRAEGVSVTQALQLTADQCAEQLNLPASKRHNALWAVRSFQVLLRY